MRCLFCKGDSSTTKSIEHIVPESLGNKSFTLPRGYICDKCNNYLAREVEKPFLQRTDMRLLRFQESIPNKKNEIPRISGVLDGMPVELQKKEKNGAVELSIGISADLSPRLLAFSKEHRFRMIVPAYSEDILPPQDMITSRFIGKIALEALAQKLSSLDGSLDQLIDDTQFDPIRNHVRRGSPKAWPCHVRRLYSPSKVWTDKDGESYQIIHESDFLIPGVSELRGTEPIQAELYFIVVLWGVEYAVNLGSPCIKGYEAWLFEHDNISPLYWGKNNPDSGEIPRT